MSDSLRKTTNKIDVHKLASEINKAKMQGKPLSEIIKNLKPEDLEKKEEILAVVEREENPKPFENQGELVKQNILQKAKSFATAVASKGFNGSKAEPQTYALRVLSCHGNAQDNLPPCPHRKDSKTYSGSHYCGGCGCGDKAMTQLSPYTNTDGSESTYTKLDFPKVTCPLEMPGFTNYKSTAEHNKTANDRKIFLELKHGVDYIKEHSHK